MKMNLYSVLCEPVAEYEALGGAEGLLEAVSFKKATGSMGRGRVTNARWK